MRRLRLALLGAVLLLTLSSVASMGGARGVAPGPGPDPEELRRRALAALRGGAPLLVVPGSARAGLTDRLRADAEALVSRYRARDRNARLVADRELSAEDRRHATLILIGRPETNLVTREIAARLPAVFVEGGFRFGGRLYRKRSHALQLVAPSPWNAERLVIVVAGAALDAPVQRRRLWFGRRDYTILDGRRAVRYGWFRDGRVDPATETDIDAEWDAWEGGLQRFSGEQVDLLYPPGSAAAGVRATGDRLDRRWRHAMVELGVSEIARPRYYLYPSAEQKGRLLDSVSVSQPDLDTMSVHVVRTADRDGLDLPGGLELLVEEAWGAPRRPYLGRGLAWLLARLPYDDEAARYVDQGFPAARRWLDATDRRELGALPGPVYRVLAASWVAFLRDELGHAGFREVYRGNRPDAPAGLDALERQWQERLAQGDEGRLERWRAAAARSRAGYRRELGFQQGFNYAATNSRDSGYATRRSQRSLTDVAAMGANAVALVPYGFSSEARLTEIRRAGDSIGSESEESLRVATAHARARGLAVMLKPQLWMSSRFWPSQIDFDREADWAAWFESYEAWIMGYALLAEELRVDLFCIGTELTYPAIEQPDRFRALIERVRRVYHGPVVYAANWYREFEEITFWDALDLIGLDNYYPLSDDPAAPEAELRRAAERIADRVETVARRFGKPVLFTEVGFESTRVGGVADEATLAHQDLLYRITFETYWPRPWFSGMYWWKWFSDPDNGGPAGDGWTPRGKPAERTLTSWFGRAPTPGRWPMAGGERTASPN